MSEIYVLSEALHWLPIEIYMLLLAIVPLGVCFAKWNYGISWLQAAAVCAGCSWVYFNLWMSRLHPPDHGLANLVYLVTGWFWLLPIFAIFALAFRLMERRWDARQRANAAAAGCWVSAGATVAITLWAAFGWMSAGRAVREARHELEKRGYRIHGRELPKFEGGRWTIEYPDTGFGEIRLDRNGRMSWIGGPG